MALPRFSSPHAHGPARTSWVMQQVLLASVPGVLALTVCFGWGTLANILWAAPVALACEAAMLCLRGRELRFSLRDCSALVTALLARRLGMDDRLTGTRLVGLAVGFLGVGALVGLDVSGGDLVSVAALIITVIRWPCSSAWADRLYLQRIQCSRACYPMPIAAARRTQGSFDG